MGFLDRLLEETGNVYTTVNNQLPGGPQSPLWSTNPILGKTIAEGLGSANAFRRDMLPGRGEARTFADVLGQLAGSANAFRKDVGSVTGAPAMMLWNSPGNVTKSLIERSLGNQAAFWRGMPGTLPGANAVKNAVTSEGRPEVDHNRTTAWDTDPKYAVLRNITEADRTEIFRGATNSQQVTNKATDIVLKYLQKEGVTIAPEAAQAFREGADEAVRLWYRGSVGDQMNVDLSEYYLFLTEAALGAQRAYDAQVPAEETTSTPAPEGLTSTAAAMATGEGQYPQTQSGAADYSSLVANSEAQTMPTDDMRAWNGSVWGDAKTGEYANKTYYDSYLGWLEKTAQPTWDRTPAGYFKYLDIKYPGWRD